MTPTILQAIISVILHNSHNMEQAFAFFAVNIRDGLITHNRGVHKIEWFRGENKPAQYRIDKKGRLFVAVKYCGFSSWAIDTNRTKNQLRVKPAIIQMNVLRASGKRGGYLIRFHVQTPVLARTKKFQFHGKWVGYWASEKMLENGLWTKSSNGKFGAATTINKVIDYSEVKNAVELLNKAIDGKDISAVIQNHAEMFAKPYTVKEWTAKQRLTSFNEDGTFEGRHNS